MSYFRSRHAELLTDDAACVVEDLERPAEVADGVMVERRSVLWLSTAAIASLLGSARLPGQNPTSPSPTPAKGTTQLSFEQFLEQLYPEAQRLVDSKGQDEEAYLMTVAAALSRLQDPKAPIHQAMRAFAKANQKPGERFPIAAFAMQLQAGKGFSHHDHLNYNGVIMGIEGEARIRNYDFHGEVPANDSNKTFEIRETRDDLILPGRFSSLGMKRENVHDLVAGKSGARVLDVFTFFAKDATSRYLEVAGQPRDQEARIYEASWKQPRRR